jgi:uncharacterized protein (TIGR02646 family)
MIKLRRPKAPAVLTDPKKKGPIETKKAIAHFAKRANWTEKFPFTAYQDPEVRDVLTKEFHGKCAYCESRYRQGAPVAVEHFRPKGAVVINGKLQPPGYYWLSATWINLLPSCTDCNSERYQEFPNMPKHLSGKANKFPVANEAKRAKRKNQLRRERRRLLHPYLDEPEQHLEFVPEVLVRPRVTRGGPSKMGEASIETFGLMRLGLVQERRDLYVKIAGDIAQFRMAKELLAERPNSKKDRENVKIHEEALRRHLQPDQVYLAMARTLIEPVLQ